MDYNNLLQIISNTYTRGKALATQTVHQHLVETYWAIGEHIVEYEQKGNAKAVYGEGLLKRLSKDLKRKYSKGFSLSNLKRMRQFYLVYPKGAKPSHLLSWSHYVEFLKIKEPCLAANRCDSNDR